MRGRGFLVGILSPLNMLTNCRCATSGHSSKLHWKLNLVCHWNCFCSKLVLLMVYITMDGGGGRQHTIIFLEGMCLVSLVFASSY